MDYRNFIRHSKPTPRAESQRKYAEGWDRVFNESSEPPKTHFGYKDPYPQLVEEPDETDT